MPESRSPVPLHTARVADLRLGFFVKVVCEACGHEKEVAVNHIRPKLPPYTFVKQVGLAFRCQQRGHKGATVDARRALGPWIEDRAMVQRSPKASAIDERRFPIRLRVAVPASGFGQRLDEMHAWLNQHVGRGRFAIHGYNQPGVRHACLWYFTEVAAAHAFVERFGLEMVTVD